MHRSLNLVIAMVTATCAFQFYGTKFAGNIMRVNHMSRSISTDTVRDISPERGMSAYIPVVINGCFGGFGVSDFAMDIYRKRFEEKFGRPYEGHGDYYIDRDDPLLVSIVEEYPDKVDRKYSDLVVEYYPSKYKGFFELKEYDGAESGYIDVSAYKVHTISNIAKTQLSDTEKVKQIKIVLADSCDDAWVRRELPNEPDDDKNQQQESIQE